MEKASGGKVNWRPPERYKRMQKTIRAMICCRELSSAIRNAEICEHNFINRGSRRSGIKSSWSDQNMWCIEALHCVTSFLIQLDVFLESYYD